MTFRAYFRSRLASLLVLALLLCASALGLNAQERGAIAGTLSIWMALLSKARKLPYKTQVDCIHEWAATAREWGKERIHCAAIANRIEYAITGILARLKTAVESMISNLR